MLNWQELTLFLYIFARMSGFVLFHPIFGRANVPGTFRGGFIMALSVFTAAITRQTVTVPPGIMAFSLRIFLELFLGFVLSMVVQFFFYIPQFAGTIIDSQMGITMNQVYDAGSHANLSTTAQLLNALMILLFFAANGHHTLLRIIVDSGNCVPYGGVETNISVLVSAMLNLFIDCTLLAVKLCMPILAAELVGELGMGILMKAIPQINVFSINIELKMLVGLIALLFLISPFSEFFLQIERDMLGQLDRVLRMMSP
jgi:flagellar biosynthetic protein FliR